jgi:ribosomal protein S16
MMFNLQSIGGYDSMVPERIVTLWRVVRGETPEQVRGQHLPAAYVGNGLTDKWRSELFPRLGISYVVSPPSASIPLYGRKLDDFLGLTARTKTAAEGMLPLAGDWNRDGVDTIGSYDPKTSTFRLSNSNTEGSDELTFQYGWAGKGWIPVAGDWNGDGMDTVGLYDPASGVFHLRNSNTSGADDSTVRSNRVGKQWIPLAGKWKPGRGDTVGLYDPSSSTFYLLNSSGAEDITVSFGMGGKGDIPLAGDWDGDGIDTIGLYDPIAGACLLRNSNASGIADLNYQWGGATEKVHAVAGVWANDPTTGKRSSIGLYDSKLGTFHLGFPSEVGDSKLERIHKGSDGDIYQVKNSLPRAYIVPRCERADNSLTALHRFIDPAFNPLGAVIIEDRYLAQTAATCGPGNPTLPGAESDNVEVIQRSLNTLTMRVNAANDGWLVVNESWDAGWKATVDGNSVEVIPGNYVFRTLPITVGEHTVEMRYRPTSFRAGMLISLSTLALVFGLCVIWVSKHVKS